ncbi:uncharacterized protein C17orf80 homolog [Acomys russatus]|uniref:uncharacterized protein C17orf80 homolog n=1 Tax=Acomys russatus TaxID=60746 RepID=UPI0021E20855|nr:uncharacterized protein C17orf80 homolog [Acomys russatus]
MGDARPRTEVCPYCQKPFKRLKSHLPHCKMAGAPISADRKLYQSKPATLPRKAKKEKSPTKDLAKAKENELKTESAETKVKSENSRSEWAAASSPLPVRVSERGASKAGGETTDQNQLCFPALGHAKRKVAPQSPVSDATSPMRELTRDESKSKGSPRRPSEMEAASLVSSGDPFLSIQDGKHSSAQLHAQPATCTSLRLGTVDPQRQKHLAKLLDMSTSNCHSPKSGSLGVQRGPPVLSTESSSLDGDHLSGVSPHPGSTETQKSESVLLGLRTVPLGNARVREHQELGLGIELCQSKENPDNRQPATQAQERACLSRGGKDPTSATKAKPQAAPARLNVSAPPEGALSKLLSVPASGHETLPSLAVKAQLCDQSQVPAITLLVGSERSVLEPTPLRHPHAVQTSHRTASYSAPYPVCKNSLFSPVAADPEAPPRAVGLEWFPELYLGYVGLGVLPRRPQPWTSVPQTRPLAAAQGGSVWKVPWLGRSSADSRSLEPLALTTSSCALMSLLGAVHKGWVRCNTTVKKSGVGRLTMLFAGYFILCCSWSFKHLKLQRWRK